MITPSWQGGRIRAMCLAVSEAVSIRTVPPEARKKMLSMLPVARVQARRCGNRVRISPVW